MLLYEEVKMTKKDLQSFYKIIILAPINGF
jgi:hypothetical protein